MLWNTSLVNSWFAERSSELARTKHDSPEGREHFESADDGDGTRRQHHVYILRRSVRDACVRDYDVIRTHACTRTDKLVST